MSGHNFEGCYLFKIIVLGRTYKKALQLNASVATSLTQSYALYCNFYCPQTKFSKGMFLHLSVSHSVHRGWAVPGQVPPGTRYTPSQDQVHLLGPGTFTRQVPGRYPLGPGTLPNPPRDQVHPLAGTPPSSACWEIRATSGRYASYWNAFLFNLH